MPRGLTNPTPMGFAVFSGVSGVGEHNKIPNQTANLLFTVHHAMAWLSRQPWTISFSKADETAHLLSRFASPRVLGFWQLPKLLAVCPFWFFVVVVVVVVAVPHRQLWGGGARDPATGVAPIGSGSSSAWRSNLPMRRRSIAPLLVSASCRQFFSLSLNRLRLFEVSCSCSRFCVGVRSRSC